MTEITLDKYLTSIGGVTRFDLVHLKLRRYLMHDIPFAVLDEDETLHMRLSRQKLREFTTRHTHAVVPSACYDARFWLAVKLDAGLTDDTITDALLCAATRVLLTLPPLCRLLYNEKNPVKYDLDYKRILLAAEQSLLAINLNKYVVDIE